MVFDTTGTGINATRILFQTTMGVCQLSIGMIPMKCPGWFFIPNRRHHQLAIGIVGHGRCSRTFQPCRWNQRVLMGTASFVHQKCSVWYGKHPIESSIENPHELCMTSGNPHELPFFSMANPGRPCSVPESGLLCDLLWADPARIEGWGENDRGVSVTFGEDAWHVARLFVPGTYWCLVSREWMGMGVAGIIINNDYGSFPHSLHLTPVRVCWTSTRMKSLKMFINNVLMCL